MQITALAGGVGGARFLRGLRAHLDASDDPALRDADITVIGNTGDDITLFGLRVCPDLDTVMYTLGGGIDEEPGLGSSRREPRRAGRARGVRRAAPVVRARRPRLRHPHRPQPAARPGLPAQPGHRGAVRAVGAARPADPAAAHDRRPGRDARRDRRTTRRARRRPSTSRSGGSGCARRCRRGRSSPLGIEQARPGPGCPGGHPGSRRDPAAAVQPGRLDRHHPGRSRAPRGHPRHPRSGRRGVARSSAADRCAGTPTPAWPPSASTPPPRRSPGSTPTSWTVGWSTPATAGSGVGRRPPGGAGAAAAHARRRRRRRDRRRRTRPGPRAALCPRPAGR